MNIESIVELLERAGLGQYKQSIASWIYPSARLVLEPVPDALIPIGGSKVGGSPDLPEDVEWPRWKDYEMTFIAQINLAECPSDMSLPTSGIISFFYAVEPMFEEEDFYADPHTCRVIYIGADRLDQISRRNNPDSLDDKLRLNPNRISFVPEISVPTSESAFLESLGLGWNGNLEEFEKYWREFLPEFWNQWSGEVGYMNRLMGHPDQIQGDMQVGCEISYSPHSWNDIGDLETRVHIINSALKWRLLLQIDSEVDKTGIMWGDAGRIYYWIHEDDLARLCFDRVICVMQCT